MPAFTLDQIQAEIERLTEVADARTFGLDRSTLREYVVHGYKLALADLSRTLHHRAGEVAA